MTRVLDSINSPIDLKKLDGDQLTGLAAEIREQMIKVVSVNGGHLASSLGTVELTIALLRIFNSREDRIVWDVGHQSYAFKMLTGRRERFSTIRQYGGLSGFPAINESPYDAFGTGHSGTSISAALGMAIARDLKEAKNNVIAVIGDGSLGAGLSFEAINHAGHLGKPLIVVLNDNGMAISPCVGALSRLLNRVRLDTRYASAKKKAIRAFRYLPFPDYAWEMSKRMKRNVERVLLPNAFWEELGFTYLGPLDGHNIVEMEAAFVRARDLDRKPTLIHILTQKGKGYPQAEHDVVKYHGISPVYAPPDIKIKAPPSYSKVFGETLCRLMQENEKIVAVSAAMLDGTGLAEAAARFPKRVFDAGICEQHAVTLAAGMASRGLRPVAAIYSTFLQRAYDQIIHDVCLQKLPVIFAIDRAGVVGEDGRTHQGSFDISFMRCIPELIIAAPSDEAELRHLLYSAFLYDSPTALRYPRGAGRGIELTSELKYIPPGKGELLRDGKDLTILALGPPVYQALEAADALAKEGIDCAVVNARFAKPLDSALILSLVRETPNILTVEENSLRGGFGTAVMELLSDSKITGVNIKSLGLPDKFIEHGPRELFHSLFNIDAEGIAQQVRSVFPHPVSGHDLPPRQESL